MEIGILSCKSGEPFTDKIISNLERIIEKEGNNLTIRRIKSKEIMFANTEVKTEIGESIRDLPIYIIQDVSNLTNGYSVNDNAIALITTIDAAKRSQCGKITVITPTYPYARQDKAIGREGITSSLYATLLEDAGAEHILTLDIHNEAISGFFKKAVLDNLNAVKNISKATEGYKTNNLVVVSPDVGGVKRAKEYASRLEVPMAMIYKERDYSKDPKQGNVEKMTLIGNVKNKDVVIVDDIIDTGGTIIKASKLLKDGGANKIYVAASLGILSGPAIERFDDAYKQGIIEKAFITDAIHHGKDIYKHPWYQEITVADYFAKVIFNLSHGKSISQLLTRD